MNFPIQFMGQGEVRPVHTLRIAHLSSLIVFIFLLACSNQAFSQAPNMQASIVLPEAPQDHHIIVSENWLSAQPGYSESWLAVNLQAGSEILTVTLGGLTTPVPTGTEVGHVTLEMGGINYQFVLVSDGGTVMIVIDDY